MKYIVKSYMRTYFSNWIESIGLLFFVIIIFLSVIGMIAAPIQFSSEYSKVSRDYNGYDGALKLNPGKLTDDFIYDYYIDNSFSMNGQIIGWDNDPILSDVPSTPTIDNSILGSWFNVGNQEFIDYCTIHYGYDAAVHTEENDEALKECYIDNVKMLLYDYSTSLDDNNDPYFDFTPAEWAVTKDTKYDKPIWSEAVNPEFAGLYKKYVNSDTPNDVQNTLIPNQSIILLQQLKDELDLDFKAYDTPGIYFESAVSEDKTNYFFVQPFSSNSDDVDNVVLENKNDHVPASDEVIINSRYAYKNDVNVGDDISLIINNTNYSFSVAGIGTRVSDFYPNSEFNSFTDDIDNYTSLYVTEDTFKDIAEAYFSDSEQKNYNDYYQTYSGNKSAYVQNGDSMTVNSWNAILNQITTIQDDGTDNGNYTAYKDLSFSQNIFFIRIEVIIFSAIGLICLLLAAVFINFIIKKEMNKTISQIGVFKAFGYSKRNLSWTFALKTAVTILIGAVVGMLLSFPMQIQMETVFSNGLNMAIQPIYTSFIFFFLIIVIVPLIFTVIGYLMTIKFLFKPTLQLLNNSVGKDKTYWFTRKINVFIRKLPFIFKMQGFYTFRSFGKVMIIFSLFTICSFLMITQLSGLNVMQDMTTSGWTSYNFEGGSNITFSKLNSVYNKNKDGIKEKPVLDFESYGGSGDQNQSLEEIYQNELDSTDSNIEKIFEDLNILKTTYSTDSSYKDAYAELKNESLFDNTDPDNPKNIISILSVDDILAYLDADYLNNFPNGHIPPGMPEHSIGWYYLNGMKKSDDPNGTNTYVSFNQYLYNSNDTIAYYTVSLNPGEQFKSPFWILNTITTDDYSNYMNLSDVPQKDIDTVRNYDSKDSGPIPVIISESIHEIDGLNKGDVFDVTIPDNGFYDNDRKTTVQVKVQNVAANNLSMASIFMGQDAFWSVTEDKDYANTNPQYQYNAIVSKKDSVYLDVNALANGDSDDLNAQYNIDVYNYFYNFTSSEAKNTYSLQDVDDGIMSNILNSPLSSTRYSEVYSLNILQDLLDEVNAQLIMVFSINIGLVTMILFVMLTVVITGIIDESLNFILILKALGYKNKEINFIVIGNYGFSIPIAVGLSGLISIPIWEFLRGFLISQSSILIPAPFNIGVWLISFGVIAAIIAFAWFVGLNHIKKSPISRIQS